MSPRATKKRAATKRIAVDEELARHQRGDEHARSGFQYECACRCLWLLELRGTEDRLLISTGEDCEIRGQDGRSLYRQVKKKETGAWTLSSDLRDFLERARNRFAEDKTTRHEFYTNSSISNSLFKTKDNTKHLNTQHEGIQELLQKLAEEDRAKFCLSIVFRDHHRQVNSKLEYEVLGEIISFVKSTYPGTHAEDLARPSEYAAIVQRLLAAEFTLIAARSEVSWEQVESQIGLENLLRDISNRSRLGGTLVTWGDAVSDPPKYLSRESAQAVSALTSGKTITRLDVEEDALALVREWGKGGHRTPRIVLIVGVHGTGKTWSLIRIGNHLATDADYDLETCMAIGPPPDDWRALVGIPSRPTVVLIDDFFSGWENPLTLPAIYLPERVLFVGTASLDGDAAEIGALKRKLGEVPILTLRPTLFEVEQMQLASAIRGVSAGQSEKRRIRGTNIRHAVQILRGEHSPPHLDELRRLLSDRGELWTDISPVLFCSAVGLSIPAGLLATHLGHTIPDVLKPWIITLDDPIGQRILFEDSTEADALLEEHFGSRKNAWTYSPFDPLVEKCGESEEIEHRVFARQLCSRLTKRNPELWVRLAKSRKRTLLALLRLEPLWAIVFCWLPAFAKLDPESELREQLFESVKAKFLEPPHSAAEFALWMEAYGSAEARGYLHRIIRAQSGWDVNLIVRIAEMIRKLPRNSRRTVAGELCGILSDLSTFKFREALRYPNAFGLLTSLVKDHARASDRERCLEEIGDLLAFEFKDMELAPVNWIEPYLELVDRAFQQRRNRLSRDITRVLVNNAQFQSLEDKFQECVDREQDRTIQPLAEVGKRIFRRVAGETFEDLELASVPGNILNVAINWSEQADWEDLSTQYLLALEEIAHREGIPLARISPIVLPSFVAVKRWSVELRKRFLTIALTWIPGKNTVATEETMKFVIKLLHLCAMQHWLNEPVRSLAKSCLLELINAQSLSVNEDFFALLRKEFQHDVIQSAEIPIMREWVSKGSLAITYMSLAPRIDWSPVEKNAIGDRMMELWGAADNVSVLFALAAALAVLHRNDDSEAFLTKVTEYQPDNADAYGVMALVEGRRKHFPEAYGHLATTLALFDQGIPGMHKWVAGWAHAELARFTEPPNRNLHMVCAELMAGHRLRSYEDLFLYPI